jgi:hypothetical protein
MVNVYISYGEETRRAAEALRLLLAENGIGMWMTAGDLILRMQLPLHEQLMQEAACGLLVIPGNTAEELPQWAVEERELLLRHGVPVILIPAGSLSFTGELGIQFDHVAVNELLPVPMLREDAPYHRALVKQITAYVRARESRSIVRMGRWPVEKGGPAEEIEWFKAAETEEKLLLVSRYGLETKMFSEERCRTWNECSLRRWLNEDFLSEAFTDEERRMILTTRVEPDPNPEYDTFPGEACEDRLFVLSLGEYGEYFAPKGDELRCCIPTPRAKWQGAFAWNDRYCLWWLRTPGMKDNLMTEVNAGGKVDPQGFYAQRDDVCVRPAMWVDKSRLPREDA